MRLLFHKAILPAAFIAIVAFFFLPFVLTLSVPYVGDYSGSDLAELNLPLRLAAADAWRHGTAPLLAPELSHGFPLLAEGQAGVFYPPNIIFFTLLPWPAALIATLALNFLLAGWFTYLLARQHGISKAGAFLAAVSFSFGGFFIFRLKHLNMINAAVWLPLVFYLLERALTARRVGLMSLALGGVLAVQFFAGHPQITYITILAGVAYTLARWRWWPETAVVTRSRFWRLGVIWLIAGALALGLAAVQLWPTLELARYSERGQWASFNDSVRLFFSPLELLTLIHPYVFGNPANDTYLGATLELPAGFWEDNMYVGLLPLLLALTAVIRRRQQAEVKIWLVLIAVSLFFIFAKFNPIFPWAWIMLPGARWFRFYQRFILVIALALAVLAGFGFDDWRRLWRRLLKRLSTPLTRFGFITLAILIVVIDLFWVGWQYLGPMSLRYFDPPKSVEYLKRDSDRFRIASILYQPSWHNVYKLNSGWSNTTDLYLAHRLVIQPNLNLLWGIESFNDRGWDEGGQLDGRLTQLLTTHKSQWSFDGRTVDITTAGLRVLGLQNVKYLLSFYPLRGDGLTLAHEIADGLLPPLKIYRNSEYLPRAFVVSSTTVAASDQQALARLFSPDFDPRQTVVTDSLVGLADNFGREKQLDATVTITSMTSRAVEIVADVSRPTFLFLSQLAYPGWQATVDGVPTPIVRSNLAFMGLALPAGAHRVIFNYQPQSFANGALISGLTLLGLITMTVGYWLRRRISSARPHHPVSISKPELDRLHKQVPADYYSRGIETNVLQHYWHQRRFRLISRELARLNLAGHILDVGCHGGDLTSVLSRVTDGRLYGVDISPDAIAFAQKRFPSIAFSVCDFPFEHQFSDGFFTAITAFDVMEHLPDTTAVLLEVSRLLRPNGYLIVAVPNENLLFRVVWWLWTKSRGQVWADVHVHDFNHEGLAVFTRHGFLPAVDKKIICGMWRFIIFKRQG